VAPFCGYVTIDPTGLNPGDNSGTITINTNAANGALTIPVSLQLVAKGAPLIQYQGVLDNGTFVPGDTVAAGDVMIVKGEQLSFSAYTPGKAAPLATELGGATVLVNGSAAPLFYSSYGQIAFQMPYNLPPGRAQVQVRREDQTSNTVTVDVAPRAPRIIAVVNQDSTVNTPDGAHPAKVGDALTIYAIGRNRLRGSPDRRPSASARASAPPLGSRSSRV
jgi:uncharacterized protein (TIGR03437 family)